uniref:EIF-4F 25 kDa subunit n=1 Tax=Macrostomum lignano TaxID=282301 RepID=A0A1I8IBJ4_9PLAT
MTSAAGLSEVAPRMPMESAAAAAAAEAEMNGEESAVAIGDPQKHPLHNRFVEDFWALFNHIQPASKLPVGCDYSLFKHGINPMWEDPGNVNGGRWLITLDKNKRNHSMDSFWIETLLLLIGEGFDEDSDEVCGAIVQIRAKQDKLSVWTRTADKRDSCVNIGQRLKEALKIPDNIQIAYQTHTDQEQKSSSMAKSTYVL